MSATEELQAAIAERDAWTEQQYRGGRLDHGMLNLPLSKRGRSDADIRKFQRLQQRVARAQAKVDAQTRREQAPARRERREQVHATADLKSRFGGCTEVFWSLSGKYLPVVRWNAKSVTVRMGAVTESIPHTQVGGAR